MTNRQLKTFIKTRLDPVLAKGYYSTLISDKDNTQEQKKIRNSFLIFRSSSKAGAVEGKLSMPLQLVIAKANLVKRVQS